MESLNGSNAPTITENPEFILERNLLAEYLHEKGYQLEDLRKLPKDKLDALMKEAHLHVALILTEIEAKSKLLHSIGIPG